MAEGYGLGKKNLDDAVAAAAMALARQPNVEGQEYVTAFIQDPITEEYFRTKFHTSGEAGRSPVQPIVEPVLDAGLNLPAMLHNHPNQKGYFDPKYLSPSDSALGRGLMSLTTGEQIPAHQQYLLAHPETLDVRRGTGKIKTANLLRPMKGYKPTMQLEDTDPVLAQFPVEEFLQHIAQRDPLMAALLIERGTFPIPGIGIPGLAPSRPLEIKPDPRPKPETPQLREPKRGPAPQRIVSGNR